MPGTRIVLPLDCNNFHLPSQVYFLPEFQGNKDISDKQIAELEERYEQEIKTFDFKMKT